MDNVSEIPRLSTNENAGVGGVVAESGRIRYSPHYILGYSVTYIGSCAKFLKILSEMEWVDL